MHINGVVPYLLPDNNKLIMGDGDEIINALEKLIKQ